MDRISLKRTLKQQKKVEKIGILDFIELDR